VLAPFVLPWENDSFLATSEAACLFERFWKIDLPPIDKSKPVAWIFRSTNKPQIGTKNGESQVCEKVLDTYKNFLYISSKSYD